MTASPSAPADLVLVGGDVATMDAARSHARGVAVAGGRIVAVGSDPEIRRRVGEAGLLELLQGREPVHLGGQRLEVERPK